MILSRFFLNQRSRDVRRATSDSQALHHLVMSMYPPIESSTPRAALGVLHRLERSEHGDALVLLVQSTEPPEVGRLPKDFLDPWLGADASVSTDLGPVLAAIVPGAILRFRLRANATRKIDTKSSPDGKRRNGRRVPVRGEEERERWIASRLERHGFELQGSCLQRPDGRSVGRSDRGTRTHEAHVFEGVVRVTDSERARAALASGIGPAKAYGFGLLSLARV
jgi:CRISPR system Cascade subunit CasE